jgi:hypothetical protein
MTDEEPPKLGFGPERTVAHGPTGRTGNGEGVMIIDKNRKRTADWYIHSHATKTGSLNLA